MKIELGDKVALVMASSKGIGFGVAKSLHISGARVAINGRDSDVLARASLELTKGEKDSNRVFSLVGDIGDPLFLKHFVTESTNFFDAPIDILVTNSGGPPAGETFSITPEQWSSAIDRNLLSVVNICKLVAPKMREKGWGRIIHLTSMTAKEPDSGMVLSNVTRAGVAAYSKTLAKELAPHGITVNTILTGSCLTERLKSLVRKDIEGTSETLDDAVVRISRTIPVGFIPSPEEFAHTILFLASQYSANLTGLAIPLDGGMSRSVF